MEYVSSGRKLLPYGMMNFADIRLDNYYYVDKTSFIPIIEQSDRFFFFIRPRRFGKSLTLNMLQHYYDVRTRDKFDALFGDLYIGKHPTRDRNSYLVLYLNFSGISGELHNYRQGLDAHCNISFDYFCDIYAEYLPQGIKEVLNEKAGAVEQLDYLYHQCELVGRQIYLFIDEYDHFTNAILSDAESIHRYTEETHKEGYLRAFFNRVKAGTYSSIKRCFITGVSPVTMDDLTSGFNIGTNYSLIPEFNAMMGFTEEEVREMLTYYSTKAPFHHTVDELIELMKPWYDNYCFAQECYNQPTLYNSNMVLYFVKNYIDNDGRAPRNMIESNIRIDYEKLRMLIRKDKEFAHDASIIQTLVSQGYITGELKDGFPAANIVDSDNFVSLLYYFGMLTVSGTFEGMSYGYGAEYLKLDDSLMELLWLNRSVSLCLYSLLDIGIHDHGWDLGTVTKTLNSFGIASQDTCGEIYQYIVENPSNYLKYYLGYLNFIDLKKEAQEAAGKSFQLKEFHQYILELGPAQFPVLEKYLLMEYK